MAADGNRIRPRLRSRETSQAKAIETTPALRILSGKKRGSSRPVLVETEQGLRLVKLRGAAQGTGALVAEIVVAELAEILGLRVPARSLVHIDTETPTDDREDELGDLLRSSRGLNLGFEVIAPARDVQSADLDRIPADDKAKILWLDRFVMNPDRTARNPNLLWTEGGVCLIDHGASLRFQYNWAGVTEMAPREVGASYERHLFEEAAASREWPRQDAECAARIERDVLERAVSLVPDSFLEPLLDAGTGAPAVSPATVMARRRAAYVAFLWKRLKAPRAFSERPVQLSPVGQRGVVPGWVTAKR